MNVGGSFSLKVSRSRVEEIFLVFNQVTFCTCERLYSFILFAAIVVNIRDVIVVDVDQAFVLVDFVASEYLNFNPFVVL